MKTHRLFVKPDPFIKLPFRDTDGEMVYLRQLGRKRRWRHIVNRAKAGQKLACIIFAFDERMDRVAEDSDGSFDNPTLVIFEQGWFHNGTRTTRNRLIKSVLGMIHDESNIFDAITMTTHMIGNLIVWIK